MIHIIYNRKTIKLIWNHNKQQKTLNQQLAQIVSAVKYFGPPTPWTFPKKTYHIFKTEQLDFFAKTLFSTFTTMIKRVAPWSSIIVIIIEMIKGNDTNESNARHIIKTIKTIKTRKKIIIINNNINNYNCHLIL